MRLPEPRGPISEQIVGALRGAAPLAGRPVIPSGDPLCDEDLQLSLYVLYELHYRGFDDAVGEREWDPALLALRHELELPFEAALRAAVPRREGLSPEEVPGLIFELAESDEGPSLSRYLGARGTAEEFREFVIHRSAYQLKEADPHSWAIPRLEGQPKSALLEVQYDEYGSGDPEQMHSRLFASSMEALGLDSTYGAYLDRLPASTLATVNLMSYLGLHRRWLGAIVGHLAMFECTSPGPNRRYANGLRRLGLDAATPFFDEHVEADSIHENLAAHDLAGGLAGLHPELAADIVFGADALLLVEARWAARLLDAWGTGASSLLDPVAPDSGVAA